MPKYDTDRSTNPPSRAGGLALAGALLLVLLGVAGINFWRRAAPEPAQVTVEGVAGTATPIDPADGVILAIQIDDEALRTAVFSHAEGMTVLDLLLGAAARGDAWQCAYRGSGATAFVTQLGGHANEGAAGRNWQYEVNGVRAKQSCGIQHLELGDSVLWKFAPSE